MKTISFLDNLPNNDKDLKVEMLLQTNFTKEIRLTFKNGGKMPAHQSPYPIIVQVLKGKIDFGVNGENQTMITGDLIHLEGAIPHDLHALEDSVVRLTLSKDDSLKRVEKVTA